MAKKRTKPQPLAPPPHTSLRSRKRARQVTTLFHKYSQKRDEAIARARAGNPRSSDQNALLADVKKWDGKLAEIGGREEYQRASQLNTSLFSTSKWVLGVLGRWGWLDGLPIKDGKDSQDDNNSQAKQCKKNARRRDVRLLEIGAINTQLLDAAARTRVQKVKQNGSSEQIEHTQTLQTSRIERVHRLNVNAIDIRSTDSRIQQIDFFDYPLPDAIQNALPYDVLVNSMVINCVTTPEQRGRMLQLCYHQLRPGGVLFLTLPKLCINQSKFITCKHFEDILMNGVGFEILDEVAKESPKLAFYVLRRPEDTVGCKWNDKFERMPVLNSGKKFRNSFGVTLTRDKY
jgi:25S rRNA (adenine2142-N1)-methyltransferase